MGEVVNVLVAFAVIIFLLKWVTSGEPRRVQVLSSELLQSYFLHLLFALIYINILYFIVYFRVLFYTYYELFFFN